jgi:hypothetical protein
LKELVADRRREKEGFWGKGGRRKFEKCDFPAAMVAA